jgi:hypothetical protein
VTHQRWRLKSPPRVETTRTTRDGWSKPEGACSPLRTETGSETGKCAPEKAITGRISTTTNDVKTAMLDICVKLKMNFSEMRPLWYLTGCDLAGSTDYREVF